MKSLKIGIFISLLALFISGCGQPVVPSTQLIYTEIVEHDKSASDSFEVSKMWLANTFNDSKAVIEYSNKENGTIIGKGILRNVYYGAFLTLNTKCTLKIEVKGNKTRFTFSDMILIVDSANNINMWNMEQLTQFKVKAKELVTEYQSYINKTTLNNW